MTAHTPDALASALPATGYVFDHIDAYEEPVGRCILLADIPKALAEAGYVLVHTAPDEATIERLARAMADDEACGDIDDVPPWYLRMAAVALAALAGTAAPHERDGEVGAHG